MKKEKLYFYQEPSSGSTCNVVMYKKAMPVYPKAIRFWINDPLAAYAYMRGIREFIKSTKIPIKCNKCPLFLNVCSHLFGHGSLQCRHAWRKIWEYIK